MANLIKYIGNFVTGRTEKGIAPTLTNRLKAYDNAEDMKGLMKTYFGFDPSTIPDWTPEELGELADAANQAQFFLDNLDKIEEHLKTYIKGTIAYNEFVARCVKAGVQGMKKVDKATLDVFLGLNEYNLHRQKIAKDSDIAIQKQQTELDNSIQLAEQDLQTWLTIEATRLQRDLTQIQEHPQQQQQREEASAQLAAERQRVRALITRGTAKGTLPASKSSTDNNKGLFSQLFNFFNGN
jgi:hypothetical protein